ncbi:MAG: glycosyltransferase family 2 protein [Bacteroidales bacterium]|nr:glycosyltransferase family 2 protein [Bacteroidales bacterium]
MDKTVTCFLPFSDTGSVAATADSLKLSGLVGGIYVVIPEDIDKLSPEAGKTVSDGDGGTSASIDGYITSAGFSSTDAMRRMASLADTPYILIYSKGFPLDMGSHAIARLTQICEDTGAGMVYSDYHEKKNDLLAPHPVIDYQQGSLRDDFNFGSVTLYDTTAFRDACSRMDQEYSYAGLYDLRLKVSQKYPLVHIQEMLYTEVETDTRKTGEKQFDYVDPRNRAMQVEMERACTHHLRCIHGWLAPDFREVTFDDGNFEFDASVVIPVKNRVKTIGDAIRSVLSQKTKYSFNLIIVDNYSTDGTTDIIKSFYSDSRVVHIIPERKNLGIGGCWNEALFSEQCGRFAIQLDSDDLYIDDGVITKIVDAFHEQQCAMVVGSYRMVNFDLDEIPPGLIDHREWTPDNGRNNALRINGLGAPRAFYTPLLRQIRVPNVSYGEDYAAGLAISRHYRIGRIYEPLYLCRRWDENSDAVLDVAKANAHNLYKDRIRTIELMARIRMNKGIH